MTIERVTHPNPLRGASASAIFASLIGPRIMLEPEGKGNGGDDEAAKAAAEKAAAEKAAAEKAAAEKAAADKAAKGNGPTDEEAKLLKEVMAKKEALQAAQEKLKAFEGIDPEEVKKLLAERAAAEEAKKAAELKAAEAAGDFERVKKMMAEEHEKALEAVRAEAASNKTALSDAQQIINDLTVGTAFSNSTFVKTELVLTPAKARIVYGDHFDVENGVVVAYDKPRGKADRTKLVDASGNAVKFEEALTRLVDADADRDAVRKSKLAPGAGSTTTGDKPAPKVEELRGVARINAALAAKAAKSA